jgi:hypothetical protein
LSPHADIPLFWDNHIERLKMKTEVRTSLAKMHEKYKQTSESQEDTIIFPFVQSGSLGISQEEKLIAKLFSSFGQDTPFLNLTTGYFALYPSYQRQLIDSTCNCHILVASPMVCSVSHLTCQSLNCAVGKWILQVKRVVRANSGCIHTFGEGFLGTGSEQISAMVQGNWWHQFVRMG